MTKWLRRAVLALVVVAIGASTASCSQTAAVDRIGLYYTGGPLQGQHFEKVVEPGSGATFLGIADGIKWLPAGQRNYIVSKETTEGDRQTVDFVRVPAKGGVDMDFEISVYFKLNTHTEDIPGYEGGTLRKFWEQIGKKYDADNEDGWDRMLNDNFRKVIEASMRQKVFSYTVDELFANFEGEASGHEDAILKIQSEIAAQLKNNINTTLGGSFFCGPTFDRDKPACPDFQFNITSAQPAQEAVRDSYSAQRVAANKVVTAQNEAQATRAQAEGTAAAQNALRGQITNEYLELQRIEALKLCAQNPNCTIINGGGSNVIVDAGRSGQGG
jgi:regulator of protease activity HflC (stomatin/prohibitin superfamily)